MRGGVVHAPEKEDAWAQHLRATMQQLGVSESPLAEHVSASIAVYCRTYHPHGVTTSDLKLLVARAFCALGERGAAARVLESMPTHARHVERWLEILSELHEFPDLLPYFSLGIVRPADWAGAQLDRMWTVDFGRIAVAEADRHEMVLYRSIRAIIENMALFFDATQGEGVLGVKNLKTWQVEKVRRKKATLTAADDLLGYMGDLFEQLKNQNDWATVPSLLNLDL